MSGHDFSALFTQYPAVIAQMPEYFNSHEFILRLAHLNQAAYIEALYHYRHSLREGSEVPFMIVHGILAQQLNALTDLVIKVGAVSSTDIFGTASDSALWRRLGIS